MTVEDKDNGWKRIEKEVKSFAEMAIYIGFQGDAGEVALIAAYNEFGTDTIPARPFMRSAIDTNRDRIGQAFEDAYKSILDQQLTAIQAANQLGMFGVQLVKDRILSSPDWAKPNAASTIARKGSSVPLVDTAQMLNSVTYVVRKGDEEVAAG